MSTITTRQLCILLKNGIQLWLDEAKAKTFTQDWQSMKEPRVLVVNGEAFSSTEIAGIFSPEKMDEYTRHRNGQWKCRWASWHDRGDKCICTDPDKEKEWQEYREKFYSEKGYYPLKNSA